MVVVDGLTVIVPVNVVIVVEEVPKSKVLVVPSFKVIVVDPVPVMLNPILASPPAQMISPLVKLAVGAG